MKQFALLSLVLSLILSQRLIALDPAGAVIEKDSLRASTPVDWNLIYEKQESCWSDNCRSVFGIKVCDYYVKYFSRYQKLSEGELLERTIFDTRKLGTSPFNMCN